VNAQKAPPVVAVSPPKSSEGTENIDEKHVDLVLFMAMKNLQQPTYANLVTFGGSFGLKTETILKGLIRKIKDGDIGYAANFDPMLFQVYQNIFDAAKITYPITFTIEDAWNRFSNLKLGSPEALVKIFQDLGTKYPDLLNFSSSQPGMPEDTISFRRLFPNSIQFLVQKRWAL